MYKVDLYVLRFKFYADGTINLAHSKPCADCCKLLKNKHKYIKIRKIYYSVGNEHCPAGMMHTTVKNLNNPNRSQVRERLNL